jgi:hypothetical protein
MTPYRRKERAERLHMDRRISDVAFLAEQIRYEVELARRRRAGWPHVCVRVQGRRVAVTWAGEKELGERLLTHLWRDGWNVLPPVRRFSRGRCGIYIVPGSPLIYDLACRFAGQCDGHADIRRTNVNEARVDTDFGGAILTLNDDKSAVFVYFDESGRGSAPRSARQWVHVGHAGHVDRVFFDIVRGQR